MINPMDMTGRNLLVTGASGGLGRDVAVLLSQLGARVVLASRREEALRETLGMMEGTGHLVQPLDVNQVDAIPAWMKEIAGRIGPFHGLVHAAGVQIVRPLRTINAAHVDEHMRPNVAAAFALSRGFRQRGVCVEKGGSIVFISSVAGIIGNPGQSLYSASKAALIGMTHSLALELVKEGIRINCVAPALVESGMGERAKLTLTPEHYAALSAQHPMGIGTGRDVANAVAFLLADTGRWITGTTLIVDGGYTAA